MKDTKDFLTNSQLGRDEVEREKNEFGRAFQCNGVPMFVIDERFVLHGAQEKEAFLRTFGKVSMEL
jgi:predicted DsbA family dithiol-disulfide isomerase